MPDINPRPLPKSSLIAALDIGSHKIACFIAQIIDSDGNSDIIGIGHTPSDGFQDGSITDPDAAEIAIRKAVHAAEHMARNKTRGYPLRSLTLNLPGNHIRSHGRCINVHVSGHRVSEKDIMRALSKAQESILSPHYELVHTIPIQYSIDNANHITSPVGMHGDELSADIHLMTGDIMALRNMADVIGRSHLDVHTFCASAYASGIAALIDDEKTLGCTIIDMGATSSSFAVFHDGKIVYHDWVGLGGQHITNDIAKVLGTPINDAERIKTLYGSAINAPHDDHEMIDVPRLGENPEDGHEPNHIARSYLTGIIQPRAEEIFEMIRGKLNDSGLGHSIGRRVVLTGGTAQLYGIKTLAEHVLDKQVRIGAPLSMEGLPDAVSGPAFSSVLGMLKYTAQHTNEMPAEILSHAEPENMVARVKYWFKENW